MSELQEYLTNQYPSDIRDIEETENLLASVAKVYRLEFDSKVAWPYQIRDGAAPELPAKVSQSTTAMILDALLRFGGYFGKIDTTPGGVKRNVFAIDAAKKSFKKDLKPDESLARVVVDAGALLAKSVLPEDRSAVTTYSGTYGKDDIFTLAWIAEVACADWASLYKIVPDNAGVSGKWNLLIEGLHDLVLKKAEAWRNQADFRELVDPSNDATGNSDQADPISVETADTVAHGPTEGHGEGGTDDQQGNATRRKRTRADVQPHAFTVLRLVQALKRVSPKSSKEKADAGTSNESGAPAAGGADADADAATKASADEKKLEATARCLQACYRYFEKLLHEHLSFSSIPDSRFDPAELMFCLEGMLVCQRKTVDRTVFDRVLSVLSDAQKESPYWRPVKPFLTTEKGYALFPVSVEIANSLMRACAIFDEDSLQDTYGSRCVGLLRRYWQWLRVRAVRIQPDSAERVGWHSEHVNEPAVIHLWETSQVMEFLLSFRNALHRHIARTTLVLSRFTQSPPKDTLWTDVTNSHEAVKPETGVGKEGLLSAYHRIEQDFIEPRTGGKGEPNFSMLLYGPPGTGKTTIASGLAAALKRRFITITVSDFLASGEAQLEARAKDIFTVLMSQPDSVVLFDEIDHFLLDRDSERYGKQDTVFQFMTPGMLTKLNDLRRKERCLFVVATNYEDRIDAAIKRTGRIDRNYLVLPPDAEKRKYFIQQWIGEILLNDAREERLFGTHVVTNDEWALLKKKSLFLGFSDIEGAVKQVRRSEERTVDELAKVLGNRARTTSLEAYQSRFSRDAKPLPVRETPIREFLCLLALYCEAELGELSPGKPGEKEEFHIEKVRQSVQAVIDKCCEVVAADLAGTEGAAGVVATHASELNERAAYAVADLLAQGHARLEKQKTSKG
ncbi:ATP-binding protein [Paraburkholderia phymatum]|uniref:AAA ATPase central domain protein n=1 Tax=Paraburkholderia phymatum (strain DSM 17167 / CIP 108236 / LMG 21445 / STM815) TaxID=391038 RepID=B2JL99_PARP8|nr:ATP-binding protein [Paraburkholderia phymatum]ACC74067.1 AAA ATPase central domain protein [Paraburkholderia phymatum STM815]